jgi:hypothetical protein
MAAKSKVAKPKGPTPKMNLRDYGWNSVHSNVVTQELFFFKRKSGSHIYKMVNGKLTNTNPKGKPRWFHFMQVVDLIWNYPGSPRPFMWHPDALRMLKAACKYKRLGVAGGGSTGKTDFFALWALVNWMANPNATSVTLPDGSQERKEGAMVLVTSTTKSAAANRVWGRVVAYWHAMIARAPGKLMASEYMICYWNPIDDTTDRNYGIKLVAGEAAQEAKSADEIRGIKGDPVILIVDEMPECGHSLLNTFEENLTSNYNNQIVGLGNPDTYFDAFGVLCEPENGWDSITIDNLEFKAKKNGYVVRLDAELSPNIIEGEPGGKPKYPFLMRADQLADKIRDVGGVGTPGYFRGIKGFWCAAGADQTIYTQPEIMCSNVSKPAVWRGVPVVIGGFDVAFTHEGDRSILSVCKVGMTIENKLTLEFVKFIEINEDVRIKNIDRTTQIVRKLKEHCVAENILPENLGIDASGPGGKAFRDAVIAQWSSKFLPVDFSGSPSDKAVSMLDKTPCNKRYDRRVSEIWFGGKALIRSDQLRGITNELAAEMVIRKYKETKPGAADNKISVETKKQMKLRTQRSPDRADSYFIAVEVARTNHKFLTTERAADHSSQKSDPVKARFRQLQSIYAA